MKEDSTIKPISISSITFEALENTFIDTARTLNWNCLFSLPFWLKTWWNVFAGDNRHMVLAARSDNSTIGIAPLMIERDTAKFLGSESVCDYQDMITRDNCQDAFFSYLLDYLNQIAVRRLDLGALRPDSVVLQGLEVLAENRGYRTICKPAGRYYEMKLPGSWEDYLNGLNGKQRHEVNRKLRRLHEAGRVDYRVIHERGMIESAVDEFLSLFRASRKDKARFLSHPMETFFHALAKEMASREMLQLGCLKLDGRTIASTFCFTYNDRVFLYNNGYDPEYRHLSAGLLSKIFSIQYNIENKKTSYDFLKGDEVYKKRLGGQPVPLYRLTIYLNH